MCRPSWNIGRFTKYPDIQATSTSVNICKYVFCISFFALWNRSLNGTHKETGRCKECAACIILHATLCIICHWANWSQWQWIIQGDSELLSGFPWPTIFKPEIKKIKLFLEYESVPQEVSLLAEFNLLSYTFIFRKQFYYMLFPVWKLYDTETSTII
jgi:hypothetical protein